MFKALWKYAAPQAPLDCVDYKEDWQTVSSAKWHLEKGDPRLAGELLWMELVNSANVFFRRMGLKLASNGAVVFFIERLAGKGAGGLDERYFLGFLGNARTLVCLFFTDL